MRPLVKNIWLDSWRDARMSLSNITYDDVDDAVWINLRSHVEDIIVDQSRDNVWWKARYDEPSP